MAPQEPKVYDLDENGERIRLASGRWKSHKEDTVDWNDQKYAEIWRQGWADTANRYLEAIGSPERLDLAPMPDRGLIKSPPSHMGPAVSQLEKKGIQTNIGNLNRDIKAANSLMQSIRQMVRSFKGLAVRPEREKSGAAGSTGTGKGTDHPRTAFPVSGYAERGTHRLDFQGEAERHCWRFQQGHGKPLTSCGRKRFPPWRGLDAYLDEASAQAVSIREEIRPMEKRVKEIDRLLFHIGNFEANKPFM